MSVLGPTQSPIDLEIMSTYKNVAVIGAPVATVSLSVLFYKETTIAFSLQQLVSNGANDVVVTCPGSSSKLPSGVKVATVDLTDVNALTH